MDIVIHGTKDGYRNLYTTNDELARIIARDVRRGAQGDEQLGQTAYSLSFVNNGVVYTKYVIVKDSLRSFATGTIAFSLFIEAHEVMKAKEILSLLNEMYGFYESKYIKNNYLNRGDTVLIREDWAFVKYVLGKYNTNPKTRRQDELKSGTEEPAFIYYQDDNELQEYLDKPFQEEYKDYSQVLFVQSNLQGVKNPINVLKNSGVELKDIDLKNKYYYLNNYNRSKGVTITANGKPRSDGKNNNNIRAKDIVEILYSKDEQCYYSIHKTGTLSDPNSELYNYIETKGENLIIKYDAFKPEAKTKTVVFDITDYSGKQINDVEIQIGDQQPWTTVSGSQRQHTFVGEGLKKYWVVSGKKGDFSGEKNVVPLDLNEEETVSLVLEEKKPVKINATDEANGDNISDFKVWINDGKGYRTNSEIIFRDEDIRKKWNIQVSKSDGKIEYFGEKKDYCPATDVHPLYITLKKSERIIGKNNAIDEGTGGQKKRRAPWSKPIVIAGLIGIILIGLGVVWRISRQSKSRSIEQSFEQQITQYVEGDSLLYSRLKEYRDNWSKEIPKIKITGGEWWTILDIGNSEKKADSTAYKSWQVIFHNINSTIIKRQLVDSADFAKLKNQQYSDQQQAFKNTINKLDSINYNVVKNKLGDVSSLTLSTIVDSINSILSQSIPTQVESTTPQQAVDQQKPIDNGANKNPEQSQKIESRPNAKPITLNIPPVGADSSQESLTKYFWNLVKSGDIKIDSYVALKRKYPKGSGEIYNYLSDITKNSESFKKFSDIPEFKRKTAETIVDLKK